MAIAGKRFDPVRLIVRRLGLLLLLVLVLGALSALWDVYKKERDSRVLREQAEAQLRNLTQQEERITAEISRLETVRGKEELLRENYEMARDGEQLIIIIEPPTAAPVEATTTPMMEWMHRLIPFW
jgi:cell division protein FtsB